MRRPAIAAAPFVLCTLLIIAATTWPMEFDFSGASIQNKWQQVEWQLVYHGRDGGLTIDKDLVQNLLLFAPLGISWVWCFRRRSLLLHAVGAVAVGLGLSLLVEGLQLLTPHRVTQLADVWRNTMGAGLAGLVTGAIFRWRKG